MVGLGMVADLSVGEHKAADPVREVKVKAVRAKTVIRARKFIMDSLLL